MSDQQAAVASPRLEEMLDQIFAAADGPLSPRQIRDQIPQAVRPSEAELANALTREGIVAYPGRKDAKTFLNRPPEDLTSSKLLARLQGSPRTRAEVIGAVTPLKALAALSRKQIEGEFDRLVQSGQIQKLPPFVGARTALFSVAPPRPADYLQHALEKIADKLKIPPGELLQSVPELVERWVNASPSHSPSASASSHDAETTGISEATPPEADIASRILQAITEINPRAGKGDLVVIADLRQRLDWQLDKTAFDRALLQMAADRQIALHQFDRAELVSSEDRELLVTDGSGRHFNAVSLWRDA